MADTANSPALPKQGTIVDEECFKKVFIRSGATEGNWYKVKAYPIPAWDDLLGLKKLVRNFEWRLIKATQHGFEFPHYSDRTDAKEDSRIEKIRDRIKNLQAITGFSDTSGADQMLVNAELEATQGLLAMAIYKRVISGILRYFDERISGKTNDDIDRKQLLDRLNNDYMEASSLFKTVRRQGGYTDNPRDDVLGEMIGEPLKALSAALHHDPKKPDGGKEETEHALHYFYDNRYRKIAGVLANIGALENAAKKLAPASPFLTHLITEFAAVAKQRAQLMRSDPDYDNTVCAFKGCINIFNELKEEQLMGQKDKPFAARVTDNVDGRKTLELLKDFIALVYDLAHVRTPRAGSTAEYVRNVEAFIAQGKAGQASSL